MRYTLRQLAYFVATGEASSILKASENIHVSQPSISSAITHLEQTFEVQLFIRHHAQGMTLTTAGQEMFREAKALLVQAERLQGFAGELAGRVFGHIEVGCFNPLAPIITPELCFGFMRQHPKTDIRVREAHQAELLRLLRQGSIDLALTYDLQLQGDINFQPLAALPPYALLGECHPLASRPSLDLKELEKEPFILLDLPLSSEYFMSLFSQQGLKPLIRARTQLTEVQRSLVASGSGYSLANVRPVNRRSLDGKSLRYIPLKGDLPALTLGIATLAASASNSLKTAFMSHCRTCVNDQVVPGMALDFD